MLLTERLQRYQTDFYDIDRAAVPSRFLEL